jgi:uncharacterized membrane protein
VATVSRAAPATWIAGVLLIPIVFFTLCQGPAAPPAHAFPLDDFGDSIRITFDMAASSNLSSVVDGDGNIHTVWEDYRSGNGDIYYVKLDTEGNKLTNDAKISNDSTPSRNPAICVDDTDHVYIVWEDVDNGTSELLFAKLWYYVGNITFQENGLRVSDLDPASSMEPDLAVDRTGNLSLVWTDARHDSGNGNLEIFYKRLRPDGTALTVDTRITGDVGVSERPSIDIDSANMAHVVWYDFRDSDDGIVINHGVFYRKLSINGSPLTTERRITFASPDSRPDIAVDTDGRVHVTFDDDRYESFDIFYTLLDNDGITILDDRNISPKDPTESRRPRMALSDSNAVDVVWQDAASGSWAIHYSAVGYYGDLEVYDQQLTGDVFANATAPSVLCAKDNNSIVLFIGQSIGSNNTEIFFLRTHRPDLAIFGGDIRLSSTQPLVDETFWINATVRNLEGDAVESVVVALFINGLRVDEGVIDSIASMGSSTLSFEIVAEQDQGDILVAADPDQTVRETYEDNNNASATMFVRMPGVTLASSAMSIQTVPGGDARFDLTVSNDGNSDFDFILNHTALETNWTSSIDPEGAVISVPGGSQSSASLTVSVPEGELPGSAVFNVTVVCTERESIRSTLALMVSVARVGNLSLDVPDGEVVEPTATNTYVFTLTNDANANESFTIEVQDQMGWTVSASLIGLELEPGVPQEIVLTVLCPRYEPAGTINQITLAITSDDLVGNTAEGTILCVAGHHREIGLQMAGQAPVNYSSEGLARLSYTLGVTNLGNSNDTIVLSHSGVPTAFWPVLSTAYLFLEPGAGDVAYLNMTPWASVLAGAYAFNITAASETEESASATMAMAISVLPRYEFGVYVDPVGSVVRHGAVVFVNVTVENWGNIIDAIDIYAYTEYLNDTTLIINGLDLDPETDEIPEIILEPGEAVVITLRIPITQEASLGSHELLLDISSRGDPDVIETASIVVVIEKKPSWFNIYTLLMIAGAATATVAVAFLYLRARATKEAERVARERRKAHSRPGLKSPAAAARKSAGKVRPGGQNDRTRNPKL